MSKDPLLTNHYQRPINIKKAIYQALTNSH